MILAVIILIGVALQALFIVKEHEKKYLSAVILKGCAAFMFLILGILGLQVAQNQDFARLVVIGLAMGMIGDILLNLRFVFEKAGQKIFLAGIAAFLAGHILYLAALIPLSTNLTESLVIGVILTALLLWWIFQQIEAKPAFKIFGVLYLGAIVLMTSVAGGILIVNPVSTHAWLYFIGAVLFTGSDIVLILNTFTSKQRFSMRIANLSLYYAGQIVIALCLQFI